MVTKQEPTMSLSSHFEPSKDAVQMTFTRKEMELARIEAKIEALYSIITPIYGDKNWAEDDSFVLNLKGHDLMTVIKDLEAQKAHLTTKGGDHE